MPDLYPQWLLSVCTPPGQVLRDKYHWTEKPWLYSTPGIGGLWTFATDRRICVYLRSTNADAVTLPDSPKPLGRFFTERGELVCRLRAGDLQAWTGPRQDSQPCPACKGVSSDNEYVVCSFCEGDGIMGGDVRPGWLAGIPIDQNLLAKVIHHVSGEAAVWCDYTGPAKWKRSDYRQIVPDHNPIYLHGEDWRCVMMPMVVPGRSNLDWDNAPWLGPATDMGEYAAMLQRQAPLHVLADWCDEHGWPTMADEWRRKKGGTRTKVKR